MKGDIGLMRKISAFDITNLTSICWVYKEKMVKNDSYVANIQIQKVATFNLDRKNINLISNKSFRYYNL